MRIYDVIDRLTLIFLLFSASFCLLSYSVAEDVSIQQSKGSKALFTTENTSLSNISDISNVSAKENISGSVTEPSTIESSFEDINNEKFSRSEFTFADVASQNSGLSNEFVDTGQAAIFTLADAATTELQQRAELPVEPSQNATPNLISNTSASETHTTEPDTPQKNITASTEDETHRSEEISQHDAKTEKLEEAIVLKTEEIAIENVTGRNEEIPSFSEWAQRQLEEAEKKKDVVNTSLHVNGGNGKGNNFKLRSKNYASLDCGAKIVAANPEAVSAGALLSSSRDEYKLNACQNRIWFIVELCEAIQAKKIDLANFELFSSSPKDFSVYVSDRFPSRDWLNVGHFTAKDERDVQSFDLDPQLFGKFVKVEMHSHHGSEHFCPISLFRVYGTSEFEVLEKENQAHTSGDDDDEDETLDSDNGQAPKNLFTSATDAVISIVKKAAEVLGNKQNSSNFTIEAQSNDAPQLINSCTTPSHLIVCDNCSDTLFGEVYELISCKANDLFRLIQSEIIKKTMYHTDTCAQYGLDFRSKRTTFSKLSNQFVRTIFPTAYIAALCNTAAVLENKVVLNVSKQFPNVTKEVPKELHVPEKIIPPPIVLNKTEDVQPTEQLTVEKIQLATAAPSDVNTTYTAQIKPTKTLSPENNINTHLTPETKEDKTVQPAEQIENKTSADADVEDNNNLEFEVTTESSEDIELINELNNLGSIQNPPTQQATPHVKESVFLRLSNRIKALERNMSLSGQYLEELSRRYKKQVEEMQRLLDKTLASLNEESKKRDEHNKKLEAQIGELSAMVHVLLEEKNSWVKTTSFIVVIFGILFGIFTFCRRVERAKQPGDPPAPKIQRRKSIDVLNHNTPAKKTRRPSDEIITTGTYKDLMRSESDVKKKVKERKKKKKKITIGRSSSFDALTEENTDTEFEYHRYVNSDTSVQIRSHSRGWNRLDSAPANYSIDWDSTQGGTDIEDVPFVLEESDISPLELPMQPIENGNGVASFVRTASEVRMKRKSSTNGMGKEIHRKGVSLDETARQPSPSLSSDASSVHNSVEDVKKGPSPKKDRKAAIKRMLKKVF